MTVTERVVGDVTVLDVNGRIAVQDGASRFGTCMRHALHLGRIRVVLNLDAVPDIDSHALGELMRASTTASQMGGNLKLLHVRRHVRDLLAVVKLRSAFALFDDEAAAVASFGVPEMWEPPR
jgi:anti-sigma B factor antagonist